MEGDDRDEDKSTEEQSEVEMEECDGDWVSEAAVGDCLLDLKTAKEYLPAVAVLQAAKRRTRSRDRATEHLLRQLWALQHDPRSCSRYADTLKPNAKP